MPKKKKRNYSDVDNAKKQQNELIPEEFPEGPFGSSINDDEPVESKSTPWEEGQRRQSAFVFPDKEQHEDLPRQAAGSHPIHDEEGEVLPEEEQ
ncbi:hypothetical protein [Virgibacillus necropolis]|uniref:Cytosolic protein n=1 Tax=Virgibacillus necropolis TaxID=163877 RepID=A0A221MB79_9BACI|nr:hypothetical protein [Virgibacillus necropolis]ASN04872.1 hypothetical protein CFK40_07520 [Virgibacillus necropolis]